MDFHGGLFLQTNASEMIDHTTHCWQGNVFTVMKIHIIDFFFCLHCNAFTTLICDGRRNCMAAKLLLQFATHKTKTTALLNKTERISYATHPSVNVWSEAWTL